MDGGADAGLLGRFESQVWGGMPHPDGPGPDARILNPTPLVDLSADLAECARTVYGRDLAGVEVWGKFDAALPTGSVKARPAVYMIREAIASGRLRGGQTVIEATSGNFGIALGQVSGLGIGVISLVSRRLQEGVFEELKNGSVQTMDLDMDICPAPGAKGSADELAARAAAANVRAQLAGLGFETAPFDGVAAEAEALLVEQDVINLAKLIARAYGFFCPEQYDNRMNLEAHRTITAPEIDQQLRGQGRSLGDYEVLCAFGTGGTSGGIAAHVSERYGRKSVHVVFPVPGQDVAGIRTKAKAGGLSMYDPGSYAAEHEVDFEEARPLLRFLVGRGHDIGESTALALYAIVRGSGLGGARRFVVMVADGIAKYKKSLESEPVRVSLEDAAARADSYDRIVWVHAQYAPREEGIEAIARSLGVDRSKITVPKASTVGRMLQTGQVPDELDRELRGSKGRSLLVCMAGNTSLMAAGVLAEKGIAAQSLNGGITGLAGGGDPSGLIKMATE